MEITYWVLFSGNWQATCKSYLPTRNICSYPADKSGYWFSPCSKKQHCKSQAKPGLSGLYFPSLATRNNVSEVEESMSENQRAQSRKTVVARVGWLLHFSRFLQGNTGAVNWEPFLSLKVYEQWNLTSFLTVYPHNRYSDFSQNPSHVLGASVHFRKMFSLCECSQ